MKLCERPESLSVNEVTWRGLPSQTTKLKLEIQTKFQVHYPQLMQTLYISFIKFESTYPVISEHLNKLSSTTSQQTFMIHHLKLEKKQNCRLHNWQVQDYDSKEV